MENIYSRDELVRNSIAELPAGYEDEAYGRLMAWLGSLWKDLVSDRRFARGLQHTRAARIAQAYIDIVENVSLCRRQDVPVYHRQLWRPMIIRKSLADTAQEGMLRIGEGGVAGGQPGGSAYGEGTVLALGRLGAFRDYVTYPVSEADGDVRSIASAIVDNPVSPTVRLVSGTDFTFEGGSLVFPKSGDPFGDGSPFVKYDVVDDDMDGEDDVETVLWASDALVDRGFVADHLSYAIGVSAPSDERAKRIVNAGWSCYSDGLTPALLRTLVAAMLNIPVIQEAEERVLSVELEEDGGGALAARVVKTDRNTYRLSPRAVPRKCVRAGGVMRKGDLLEESVKIYPFLTDIPHLPETSEFADVLKTDVPVIDVPPDMLRTRTAHGIYVTWDAVTVRRDSARPLDGNGNPRLYFPVFGAEGDPEAFWDDVWRQAEREGVSMADYVGEEGSEVVPAQFFLRHMMGANTLVMTVDRNQLDDMSMMRDPMFFDILSDVVPSAIRLFLVEHMETGEDGASLAGLREDADAYAGTEADDEVEYGSLPGLKGRGPSYGEDVNLRLVRRNPRRSSKTLKEEW